MKNFFTLLLLLMPLAVMGQAVSRTELGGTNTLIDARIGARINTTSNGIIVWANDGFSAYGAALQSDAASKYIPINDGAATGIFNVQNAIVDFGFPNALVITDSAGDGDFLQGASSGDVPIWNGTTWITGAQSGTISGADTRVVFFDGANTPAGDGGLTFNKTTDSLGIGGALTVSNSLILPWRFGVAGGTVYATNGPNQLYNLGSHTNLPFAPLSGADASNSVPILVRFTQNATGGFYPTNNGTAININTNPNQTTLVSYEIVNGATNVGPSVSFLAKGPAAGDFWTYDTATGNWTNLASTGTGTAVRNTSPTFVTPTLGAAAATTPATGDADTSVATTAFVDASLIASNSLQVNLAGAQTIVGTKGIGSINVNTQVSVAALTSTQGVAYVNSTISGVGGANTNFTGQASDGVVYIDGGTTNVNFVAIMPGATGLTYFPTYVISNLTTTARLLSFSQVTNFLINLQQYDGVNFPITITNKHRVLLSVIINGSNTTWAAKQCTNGF